MTTNLTVLENVIASLTTPDIALTDALRSLYVVSRRIGDDDTSGWIWRELNGYDDDATVPEYRRIKGLPITLRFDGYGGTSVTRTINTLDLPEELQIPDEVDLRQPLAELMDLADGDSDPRIELPLFWMAKYRKEIEAGRAPSYYMMTLNHAKILMPRTALNGLLDRIKSEALDYALSVERIAPEAGTMGGPTAADNQELKETAAQFIGRIFTNPHPIDIGASE